MTCIGFCRPQKLFDAGYSSSDVITTLFRVVRNTEMPEFLKLEYIKVTSIGNPLEVG